MIEKQYFLEEIHAMSKAILSGDIKSTDHRLISELKEDIKEELSLPVRTMAERLAINDLNKIKEAFDIMYNYEKAGVKFEFINYKSKED